MQVIRLAYLTVARAFYSWALREIDPLHPDVPKLVLHLHELDERTRHPSGRHAQHALHT